MKCRWNRTMLNLCGIVVAILKMATGRNFSMSGIISEHHNLPTYEMALKSNSKNFYRSPFSKWPLQYRTNSTLSDFNVISYVGRLWCPELIPDIEKFLPVAIFKMATTEIVQCRESIRDIIIYPHIKFGWYRKILNFCGIVAAILKMATGRDFSISGINSGHHYLPTYEISTIPQKFNIVQYRQNLICGYIMMSWIDSQHWTISTGRHFQNGHYNTAQIQHCLISKIFHMWVDCDDVGNQFRMLKSNNVEFVRYCGDHFENGDW
jgi:hypothetical protein